MVDTTEPTEEEMEAYRRRMKLSEDPMSKFFWSSVTIICDDKKT